MQRSSANLNLLLFIKPHAAEHHQQKRATTVLILNFLIKNKKLFDGAGKKYIEESQNLRYF
jgi:hypothetical protein